MSIFPLDQFEMDVAEYRREAEERAREANDRPKTLVVRFGRMRLIGEYHYRGEIQPGCGSKMVVKTHRGTELAELLTSMCKNAGCGSSVTRQEMLGYIDSSGGKDYPFFSDGRALRVATAEDMQLQAKLEEGIPQIVRHTREEVAALGIEMKVIDAEPILGGERLTIFFTSEDRVDFRELTQRLSGTYHTRIDLRQVGARDEARLTADYERCGQYCCCKQFLKVLKPVSMRSAKVQKATLDPLKISGRCGRLMCCLRYEDETYTELRKNLPHRKARVGTDEGPGIVVDTQILTQLALVELDADRRRIAVPIENLISPEEAEKLVEEQRRRTERELEEARLLARSESRSSGPGRRGDSGGRKRERDGGGRMRPATGPGTDADREPRPDRGAESPDRAGGKKKRSRRRPRRGGEGGVGDRPVGESGTPAAGGGPGAGGAGEGGASKKKKRRRRRGRGGGGHGGGGEGGPKPGGGSPG
jgi:cell fate regulator YaaT (PSP1 superfamily)